MSPEPRLSRPTILLAEDDANIRTLVSYVLRGEGYLVLPAPGGAEALSLSTRHPDPLHLLITDMKMPGMSGLELIDHLLPLRPGLRILCMTGCNTDELQIRSSVWTALAKPFSIKELIHKVRQSLGESAGTDCRPLRAG